MRNSEGTHHTIQVGDTVALRKPFVDRHSWYTNSLTLARGTVKAIHYLDKVTLADIQWDKPGPPKRMNVKNLTTCQDIPLGA